MRRELNGPRGRPDEALLPHTANDALLRWDEIDEQLLRMLEEDPERGWRLRKLQDADGWLRSRASEAARKAVGPALLVCPPPEDLYDFGQGPGSTGLAADRRQAIDRHLATCLECERFVATLQSVPPSPLILGLPAEEELDLPQVVAPATEPRRTGLRLLPLLASAAAVVLLFLGVRALVTPTTLRFPEAPLLRGSAGGQVYYPRGRVLLPSAEVAALFPALAAPLRFEAESQAEADRYHFEWSRHTGGAMGPGAARPLEIDSATHVAVSKEPKQAGRYTAEAWVTRHGLPTSLGQRDFQVVPDPELEARLLALASEPEAERVLAAVHLLHSAGYVTDARELARTLPPTRERDRYLDQVPGR